MANMVEFLSSPESEWDHRGRDQPDFDLAGAEPAHRRHLLLHHGPLRPPRLLRHLLRTATERECAEVSRNFNTWLPSTLIGNIWNPPRPLNN